MNLIQLFSNVSRDLRSRGFEVKRAGISPSRYVTNVQRCPLGVETQTFIKPAVFTPLFTKYQLLFWYLFFC